MVTGSDAFEVLTITVVIDGVTTTWKAGGIANVTLNTGSISGSLSKQ